MPGRFLIPQTASREAGKTMGVYKLSLPGPMQESLNSKSGFRNAFMGRRFHNDYRNLAQASSKTSLEAPEMEHFTAISGDEYSSVFTASSTRTSNTVSDDDSSLMEFASRTSISADDFAPGRHSTACCSDLAFRRELRKRFHVDPTVDEEGLRRDSTSSFALGSSFRRELEKEDRVESLALWEETDHKIQTARNVVQSPAPHSWHAGDTAASSGSTRNKGLDNILRKKKSSFFNGFFSGLSFSSSRKSRKSLG